MSQYRAQMTVINASSQPISGTATYSSGDGPNKMSQSVPVTNLAPFTAVSPVAITARNNHDDYWYWGPDSSTPPVRERKNLDRSAGAVLVISDNLLVVVTSDNGVDKKQLPKTAAAD